MNLTRNLTAAALIALAAAAPASAETPAPTCGYLANDPAGDSASKADQLDLVGAWFDYNDDGSVTANIQVKNLSQAYPGSAQGMRWRIAFKVNGGAGWYAGAFQDLFYDTSTLADPYFEWGTVEGSTASFEGIADGKLFLGENGVVRVRLPREMAIKDDDTLTNVSVITESYTPLMLGWVTTREDSMEVGSTFQVAPCKGAAAGSLPVTVGAALGSAKKAAKARKATVKLSSAAPLSNVEATLMKGSAVLGRGTLSSLSGSAKLTLKLSKSVRKGSYTLMLKGVGEDGNEGAATAKVKFS